MEVNGTAPPWPCAMFQLLCLGVVYVVLVVVAALTVKLPRKGWTLANNKWFTVLAQIRLRP
jgi:hypothetical protein